jgi:shikimate kinase
MSEQQSEQGHAQTVQAHNEGEANLPLTPSLSALIRALNGRSLVLIGLMGAGKSTIGRRLAGQLHLPFKDSDHQIEIAAGMPIPDIFDLHGEMAFRDVEQKVIVRLLMEGPMVLATGGGAFMKGETRENIKEKAVSIWLDADLDVLMRRVRRRANRPLLNGPDPEGVMRKLMEIRNPIYALSDMKVVSHDGSHDDVVIAVIETLQEWLAGELQGEQENGT